MGSSYFGEPNMGNDRGTSRRSRKGSSEKPKQPQRGLGVAQLEKIRLHGQMASSGSCSSYGQFHHQYPSGPYPTSAFSQEDFRGQTGYSSTPSSSFSYTSSSSTSASYGLGPNFMMGGDHERGSIRSYGDNNSHHHSSTHASWGTSHGYLDMPQYMQPAMTRHLLNLHVEDPHAQVHHRSSSLGSSHKSETNDAQELDLELRLSL
ncbi:protein SPEAR1 isoform X2 [Punica granatum]|uniref:Protein SPEAR1 isoform X2 n=1 Tax=Punica granatum TaxID=22663 RepID=A0A6P8CBQ9_PUNGR|nr:protein SPEAR1 isoform X2 [Punica granatum]